MRRYSWLLLALVACGNDESFLAIRDLCVELATNVCEARGRCCAQDPATCRLPEEQRCRTELESYEREDTLTYDSASAGRRSSKADDALDTCGPAPSLAIFFEGGAVVGTPCERNSQCASGSCVGEPRVCTDVAAPPLCPAP